MPGPCQFMFLPPYAVSIDFIGFFLRSQGITRHLKVGSSQDTHMQGWVLRMYGPPPDCKS
jgi:hypothetical protein